MASESSGRTFQEYLEHHLQNLVYGPLPAGHERKFYTKGDDETTKVNLVKLFRKLQMKQEKRPTAKTKT